PLKPFFAVESVVMFAGTILGARFIWFFEHGSRGHVQSVILAAVFLVTGFQTWLIALLADLIAVNRRLSEEVLIRLKKLESRPQQQQQRQPQQRDRDRKQHPQQPPPPAAPKQDDTQSARLIDERQ